MFKWILLVAFSISLCEAAEVFEGMYIFCIEGGGSKTILQVIDQNKQIVPLMKDGILSDRIETGPSNINTVNSSGVREALQALFQNVKIGNKELVRLIPHCHIVAGMAGAASLQNQQAISLLLEEWGFVPDHIQVLSDAEMALQLVEGNGIILIAGTGSICLGKNDRTHFRVGGLGRLLGDEGSGYKIGLEAIKASLAEEYGWGPVTSLRSEIKQHFSVSELKQLISKIQEIPPSKIASCAPLVYKKAWEKDPMANEIIDHAAQDLAKLIATMLKISQLKNGEVHLWGGLFKSPYAASFIKKIAAQLPAAHRLKMINKSHENPALLYAQAKFPAFQGSLKEK